MTATSEHYFTKYFSSVLSLFIVETLTHVTELLQSCSTTLGSG